VFLFDLGCSIEEGHVLGRLSGITFGRGGGSIILCNFGSCMQWQVSIQKCITSSGEIFKSQTGTILSTILQTRTAVARAAS